MLTTPSPTTRGFKHGFEFSCCDFLSEDSNSVRFVSNLFPKGKTFPHHAAEGKYFSLIKKADFGATQKTTPKEVP
jgi:hypothetical protein